MAGQIAPKNLFDLRPDLKALMCWANLKSATPNRFLPQSQTNSRKSTSIFCPPQLSRGFAGAARTDRWPKLSPRQEHDVELGWNAAKKLHDWISGKRSSSKTERSLPSKLWKEQTRPSNAVELLAREGAVHGQSQQTESGHALRRAGNWRRDNSHRYRSEIAGHCC
jgi:hypothetical protein